MQLPGTLLPKIAWEYRLKKPSDPHLLRFYAWFSGSLLSSFLHTRISYLKRILEQEKEVARLMSADDISSRFLMKELHMVNIYQIKILEQVIFMFKVKNSIIPRAFN